MSIFLTRRMARRKPILQEKEELSGEKGNNSNVLIVAVLTILPRTALKSIILNQRSDPPFELILDREKVPVKVRETEKNADSTLIWSARPMGTRL